MVEIQETGSYFHVDKEGFLVNPAAIEKIQDDWRPLIDELAELYKKHFGEQLVSVYLRGSVSKGEAIKGVSDIDSWCYVDLQQEDIDTSAFREDIKKLNQKYTFSEGIESGVDSLSYVEEDQFWIAQAALLYGKDLQEEKFKIGKEIMFHSRDTSQMTNKVTNFFKKEYTEKDKVHLCVWLCKQILRSVIELCFERSGKYSRDLYRCWETFTEYYPEKSDEMREVLHLALNPTADEQVIRDLEQKWTKWIIEEKEKLGYE